MDAENVVFILDSICVSSNNEELAAFLYEQSSVLLII